MSAHSPEGITLKDNETGIEGIFVSESYIKLCYHHRRVMNVQALHKRTRFASKDCVACQAYDQGYAEGLKQGRRETT